MSNSALEKEIAEMQFTKDFLEHHISNTEKKLKEVKSAIDKLISKKSNELISNIIRLTDNNLLPWQNIATILNNKDLVYSNPELYYLLSENEYHRVFKNKSFAALLSNMSIFLVYEYLESDDATKIGYNLYIQFLNKKDNNNHIIKLNGNNNVINNLAKSVLNYLKTTDDELSNVFNKLFQPNT